MEAEDNMNSQFVKVTYTDRSNRTSHVRATLLWLHLCSFAVFFFFFLCVRLLILCCCRKHSPRCRCRQRVCLHDHALPMTRGVHKL